MRIRFNRKVQSICFLLMSTAGVASAQEIPWITDYAQARQEARDKRRPLVLDFGTANCYWCRRLEATTFRDPQVVRLLADHFVAVKIDANRDAALAQFLGISSYPTLIFADPEGKLLGKHVGYVEAARFVRQLRQALEESSQSVPQRTAAHDQVTQPSSAPPTSPGIEREQAARAMLALAQEEYRTGQYLCCLERCKQLAAAYPDTAASQQANQLAVAIRQNPTITWQLQRALTDAWCEVSLARAESALQQGQLQEALALLERIRQLDPASQHAAAAQKHLERLRPSGPGTSPRTQAP